MPSDTNHKEKCRQMNARVTWLILSVWASVVLTCSGKMVAGEVREARFPDIGSVSFEERNQRDPLASPLAEAALLLPRHELVLKPQRIEAAATLNYRDSTGNPVGPSIAIWRRIPWRSEHAEWLEYRKDKLTAAEGTALLAWCDRKGLKECAAYETRRLVKMGMKAFDPGVYRNLLTRLVPVAQAEQPSWNFPLPLDGEWCVLPDRSGHHRFPVKEGGATFAYDLVILRNGQPCVGSGRLLTDYLAWDQPIRAQADGVVLAVAGHFPDMPVGRAGSFYEANAITINYGGGVLVDYGHLKQNSIELKVGDPVVAGQVIGRIGNSGASGMPHLHMTFGDAAAFSTPGRYRIEVQRGNRWVEVADQDLVEGSYVRNRPGAWPAADLVKRDLGKP
jgi:hypothetical protein